MRQTKSSFHAPFHSTSRSYFSPMSKQNTLGIFVSNTQVFRHKKEGGLMGDEEFEEKKKLLKEKKLLAKSKINNEVMSSLDSNKEPGTKDRPALLTPDTK